MIGAVSFKNTPWHLKTLAATHLQSGDTSPPNALIDLAADEKPPSGKQLFGGLNPINC